MAGFNNAVVGGSDDLIRSAIQSPNYVTAVSGWTINRDGSAEFNDLTVRGTVVLDGTNGLFVYDGAPGVDKLIVSLSSVAGTDPYGNTYPVGLSFRSVPAATAAGIVSWGINELVGHTPGYIAGIRQPGGQFQIEMASEDALEFFRMGERIDAAFDRGFYFSGASGKFILDATPLQVNAGAPGLYYSEQLSLAPAAGTNVPNNADTIITPTTSQALHSDYGTAWSGNTWTCPVEGDYNFTMPLQGLPAASPRVYGRIVVNGNIVLSIDGAIGGQGPTVSGTLAMTAGDTMQVHVFQNSGAAVALGAQARIHIRREL